MAMPFFRPGDDPGSSFPELLHRVGLDQRTGSFDGTRLDGGRRRGEGRGSFSFL